jgi:hypothetical protein
MRRYQLTINGKTYTVLVSELSSERFAVQLDGREFEVQVTESGEVSEILPRQPLPPLSRQLLPPQFLHRQHLYSTGGSDRRSAYQGANARDYPANCGDAWHES